MSNEEPSIFQIFPAYMKLRLMFASAILFRISGWKDWSYGHAKLFGVVLWNYEIKEENSFKYSRLLKRHAYGRTQNYKLLRGIVERNILKPEGNGYYSFSEKNQKLIKKILKALKNIDRIGNIGN
jgi:hypothetical protein